MYGTIHPRDCYTNKKKLKVNLMTDYKFERSLNDLFCDFAADILNLSFVQTRRLLYHNFKTK